MTIRSLLEELSAQGIRLWPEGEQLRYQAPDGRMTPERIAILKQHKADLLAYLKGTETHPLSYSQEGIWFDQQLAPESEEYHISCVMRVYAAVDAAALQRALQMLVERHAALRTTFEADESGSPQQRVHHYQPVAFQQIDAQGWSDAHLNEQAHAFHAAPFDLIQGPLFRVALFTRRADDHLLVFNAHHLVVDFQTIAEVIIGELQELYQAAQQSTTTGIPLPEATYVEYVNWQRGLVEAKGEELLDYWRTRLAGKLPLLDLPTDQPYPSARTQPGVAQSLTMPPALYQQLRTLARHQHVTLNSVLLTAYYILLHRYTNQDDLLVGLPTQARSHSKFSNVAGYFISPIVVRATVTDPQTASALLKQVHQTTMAGLEHQDYPFPLLVAALQPPRNPGRHPIFQAAFQMVSGMGNGAYAVSHVAVEEMPPTQEWSGLPSSAIASLQREAIYDLFFVLRQTPDNLQGVIWYSPELFKAETVARIAGHFVTLLESMVADPGQSIGELSVLPAAERQQILVDWNDTVTPFPSDTCMHQLFEEQVERTPDAVAVEFEEESLTYAELNAQANQLAYYLREQGVGPDVLVGLCLDRSMEMLVALLGIFKAGGAYVPLDPAYPQERLAFMLTDSGASVLVTQQAIHAELPLHAPNVVYLDAHRDEIAAARAMPPVQPLTVSHLAYVIYTSGSTGKPKGVQIPHVALTNFLCTMQQQPGLTAEDVLLSVTTLSFDIAALELYLPLIVGARVVIAPRAMSGDAAALRMKLAQSDISVMQATPVTWRLLVESGWQGDDALKVLCGGEALSPELARELLSRCGELWNVYGPTETTIWSTVHRIQSADEKILIGRPIANTDVYVLNSRLQPVPIGVAGELYIGGVGVARGYLNRPELTAERFIPHPFSDRAGDRLYRTGDLVRWQPDGTLEHLGRIDHQVKIRGFRIELGEIESALLQHPEVENAVVVAFADETGDKQLVAYIVSAMAESNGPLTSLRQFLRQTLPEYMVPTAFVTLDAMPLTPNGKIDRRSLPAPHRDRVAAEAAYTPPQTEIEKAIVQVWQRVLQLDKVGIHDNFFDIGGHSLRMAQVHRQLAAALPVELTIVELFQYPTIHALAQHVHYRQNQSASDQPGHRNVQEPRQNRHQLRGATQRLRQRRRSAIQ